MVASEHHVIFFVCLAQYRVAVLLLMIKEFQNATKLKNISFRFIYLRVDYRVHVVSLPFFCIAPPFVAVDKVHCLK